MTACDACLRRSALVGFLAPQIARLLDDRRRAPELLALPDDRLVAAVAGGAGAAARAMLRRFDADAARGACEHAGLFAVCRHAAGYPEALRPVGDAPAVLHCTGSPERLDRLLREPAVAVVGTRRASAYGLEVAEQLGRGLSAAGVTVVSGMALGVDAAAHRGALAAGGRTVAVLGCGADRPYPRAHRSLYARIREAGTVMAELPPGAPPRRWTFPARNRIMAGLAQVTVVVEGAERSGSLITARYALDLGREVAAVPGRVNSRVAAGANSLLFDGARLVRGPADVLDVVFGAGGWRSRVRDADVDAGRDAAADLDPNLRQVLDAVEQGAPPEDRGAEAGLSAGEVRAALGRLEVLGLVRRDGLGAYERAVRR
ncbi:MAG TPA: DNA-processing protein DprA [Thermoleophilaceae bacterium]